MKVTANGATSPPLLHGVCVPDPIPRHCLRHTPRSLSESRAYASQDEDKAHSLSDEDLVTKLNDAGYPVARRTVTKYRKMLNIPSSRQRKDWSL